MKQRREVDWSGVTPIKQKKSSYKPREVDWSGIEELNKKESTGWTGVGEDIAHKGLEFIQSIPEAIRSLPKEAYGVKQQITQEPNRAGLNVLAGFGNLGHKILSSPGVLRDYLVKKELVSPESSSFRLPESILPKEYDYASALGVEGHKPGDVLLQGLPETLASAPTGSLLAHVPGLRSPNRHLRKLENLKEEMELTSAAHSGYLGQGQAHAARAADAFLNHIEGTTNPLTGLREGGLRKQVGSQYDKLTKDLLDKNVQVPITPDLKQIQSYIQTLGPSVSEAEKANFAKILQLPGHNIKNMSAADALTAYRELKHQRGKAEKFAHSEGISPQSHEDWMNKAKDIAFHEEKLKNILDKLNPEYLQRLKTIDKEYATKIAPLYKNKMYQEMLEHGQTSKDMMKYLHGSTPGNETLKQILKNSPELQRLIVGQKFAGNISKIAEPNEMLANYAKINPNIARIIKEQNEIKHANEVKVPKLEKAIQKAHDRRNFRRGAAATLGTGGALLAAETALGRDWKEDVPTVAGLVSLLRGKKK